MAGAGFAGAEEPPDPESLLAGLLAPDSEPPEEPEEPEPPEEPPSDDEDDEDDEYLSPLPDAADLLAVAALRLSVL